MRQPPFMLKALAAAKSLLFRRSEPQPDLGSQMEELMIEVWRQEAFERTHPFTCAVIRQASASLGAAASGDAAGLRDFPQQATGRRRRRLEDEPNKGRGGGPPWRLGGDLDQPI